MRQLLLLTTILLTGVAALPAQQHEMRALPAAPDVAIRLWVPAGTVEVEGWDRDSVEVHAWPAVGTSFGGGGGRGAMKFALEAVRTTDTLLPSARLVVRIPRGAKLWIKSTAATVDARHVGGELDVLQVTGRTTVMDAGGVITVESIDGAIRLLRVDGVVRIRGGSGSTRIEDLSGTLDASLVSGNVLVTKYTRPPQAGSDDPGPALQGRIETVSGKVWFLGALGRGGTLEVATHDGLVDLQLLGGTPPLVETAVRGAAIAAPLRRGDPAMGRFVLRSFKGSVNAAYFGGI